MAKYRKALRNYRHKLPKTGPGMQTGSDIRRIQCNVMTKMQDEGHETSIPFMLGGIEAAATICEDYMERMDTRLRHIHDLFTSKQIATTVQARWYQKEITLTEGLLADVQSFRQLLAEERGLDPRFTRVEDQSNSSSP